MWRLKNIKIFPIEKILYKNHTMDHPWTDKIQNTFQHQTFQKKFIKSISEKSLHVQENIWIIHWRFQKKNAFERVFSEKKLIKKIICPFSLEKCSGIFAVCQWHLKYFRYPEFLSGGKSNNISRDTQFRNKENLIKLIKKLIY